MEFIRYHFSQECIINSSIVKHLKSDIPQRGLPVEAVLEDLQKALCDNAAAVLQAPPGAGKTTCIPLSLLNASWLGGRKTLLLAPRRLAARAAAGHMADLLQERVGQTVGYRVRLDSRVSAATRIEVVTEGVLTRMLQSDPALDGVGLVIFDEFHERSLDADLGLALCLDMQGVLNQELRLLIMSATIETAPLAALLDDAPVITCPGRSHAVETRYVGRHTPDFSGAGIGAAVLSAARSESGSILVFLPGAAEIRQVARLLEKAGLGSDWIIAPLFGNLPRSSQDQAIEPAPGGKRKIVLATSIAETSLTIEGIRVVVDSGWQRVPRYDVRSGLTRLVTIPVSRASADQRRGRAGRIGPGICLRLWSHRIHHTLPPAHKPEILEADLAGLALELAIWGVADPSRLRWLDPPSTGAYDGACRLLQSLGALDDDRRISDHGSRMAALPLHPRLAHMMLAADSLGLGGIACDLAALLSERDVVRFNPGRSDADMRIRLDLVQAARRKRTPAYPDATIDFSAVRRVVRTADHLRRSMGGRVAECDAASIGRLLAWAYPDRVARRRPAGRGTFLLANGRGAVLDPVEPLAAEAFVVAVELDGNRRNARIYRAAACDLDILMEQFAEQIHWAETVAWDPQRRVVAARRDLKLGALTLRSEPLTTPASHQVLAALLEGIRQQGPDCLPWTRALRHWQNRVCFLRRLAEVQQQWPDVSDDGLTKNLAQWLAPYLTGISRLRDLARIELKKALASMLSYQQRRLVDELAPSHLTVPSGSRIPIDYSGDVPVLAVRLQEMFGLSENPAVAGGRQPLQIHLLSPAGRPVQITQDLAGFWQTGYAEVKKELKGRYPKHYWPDDPLQAQATARVRPRIMT
ncbi:ATP-dependent helicase HrpB [Olavius sp. associated proteobacterium Delta 1]|nr:ATP-dependent helicase HrpB [Olavius sp. associated proteobacterium Delta 1]